MMSVKHPLPTAFKRWAIMCALLLGFPTVAISASDEQTVGELMDLSG